ncbi:MAG TPA: pyridoxal phosphate-dependent aminotransferase, partial [Thermotogota bacterium]|nr:pyridoxal phosphate-dependent aminotransferase [Thermotogota bacterium]
MDRLNQKFLKLGVDNAPGQQTLQDFEDLQLIGENIPGRSVDFSHGDVNAFEPIPG